MKLHLANILHSSAEYALSVQARDGSFPNGHNGPYHDPETPVRNSAHWLFLMASLYEKTGEEKWRDGGEKAIGYLMSFNARPYGKTFHCRDKQGKDSCNGLVGQAWVIEALVKASEAFDRQDCYDLAEEIFLLHPWDKNIGIWHRVEVDGTILSHDNTFNHQLWFAATGGLLKKSPKARKRARNFLEKVATRLQCYPNGIIFHDTAMGTMVGYLKTGYKPFLRELKARLLQPFLKRRLYSKSVGYHAFNLYAFALFKKAFPDAHIWRSAAFHKIINAHRGKNFFQDLQESEFGFYYNVAGIEIAYAVETFLPDNREVVLWLNRQFKITFVNEKKPLSRGASDANTAMARIYQAARFSIAYEVTVD